MHLSNYMTAMDKAYKTQIYFCFKDVDSGENAFKFLKNVYADECNYDAWSGWFGIGDKRDFYLGFVSAQARDNVYNDIKNAVDQYESTNQYQEENLNGGSGEGQDAFTAKSKDWTTYLIIGAAVVAVIMLLWDRKKKK